MLKPSTIVIEKLMHMYTCGASMFPFRPADVDGIYTRKVGVGPGVWFHLKDGRVFDSLGSQSEPDATTYGEKESTRDASMDWYLKGFIY